MKLASENKINAKNAFDLHLIDYLKGYMTSLQSLQVLSTTLDAGAKIYAGRVDLVHNNTYEILTGCGGPNDESTETDGKQEPLHQSDDEEHATDVDHVVKTRKPKKRNGAPKKLTCDNIKKIRLTAAQVRCEVDPLFKSQAHTFDKGGSSELRSNNVRLLDNNYQLLLDFDTVVTMKCGDLDQALISDQEFDISEFSDLMNDLAAGPIDICTEFKDFRFTCWDKNDDDSAVSSQYKRSVLCDETLNLEDAYGGGGDDDGDYFNVHEEYSVPVDMRVDDVTVVPQGEMSIGQGDTVGSTASLFMSSVREMVETQVDNYGEVSEDVLGMWAGPDHWRRRIGRVIVKADPKDIDNVEKKARKAAKAVPPLFSSRVETKVNEDGVGRLVVTATEPEVAKGNRKVAATQLSDDCVNRNMKKESRLPPMSRFVLRSLYQLMNREVSLVSKAFRGLAEQIADVGVDDDQLLTVDRNMASEERDTEEHDQDMMVTIDDDGNMPEDHDDYNSGEDDAYTGLSFRNGQFEDYGEEVPVRQEGGAIDIEYSKTAKKINAKRIKEAIESCLVAKIDLPLKNRLKDDEAAAMPLLGGTCLLSVLVEAVNARLPKEVARDLSVPILLTCLLHFANEAGLEVGNTALWTDFSLGHGYTQDDLDQIRRYGSMLPLTNQG